MSYLLNAWESRPRKFDLNIKAIANLAGDDTLMDPDAVKELRKFFEVIDLGTLGRLLTECYSQEKRLIFDGRGFAFQDLVNEMGRRLGYNVTNGLYKGRIGAVGYDGLWNDPYEIGSQIIMEAKVTGDYSFSPATVARYRNDLISQKRTNPDLISVLIVYGRDDKNAFRNVVRGGDTAGVMRVISAKALFRLVEFVTENRIAENFQLAHALLRPQDYYVLDNLVKLILPDLNDGISITNNKVEHIHQSSLGDLVAANDAEKGAKRTDSASVNMVEKERLPDKKASQAKPNIKFNKKGTSLPPLPDKTLKVGQFFRQAMSNLATSGFEFTDQGMNALCGNSATHDVVGMGKKLPFFKVYDPKEDKGNYINGVNRFYAEPLTYGNYTVYLTKEIIEKDREAFVRWYEALGVK